MPRDGSGVYSLPAGGDAVPGELVASTPYNAFRADLVSVLNGVQPVSLGGTGASNASGARSNLGLGALATRDTINDNQWSGVGITLYIAIVVDVESLKDFEERKPIYDQAVADLALHAQRLRLCCKSTRRLTGRCWKSSQNSMPTS